METSYIPTIGLEIHAELKTYTKMFCCSKNDASESRPNVNICPVCLAHPGTLPLVNSEAVQDVLKVGLALGAKLADYTEFDRKSYFYPDLPKGYQISQYEFPLVSGGVLRGVAITRVHLEEDTASSVHDDVSGATLIDYNRAGVPLMELVTEPVIHSAEEAGAFARELQLLLRYLGVSDADMEKGQMRVEANISVGRDTELGTKVEVKNLNSFRAMERAVAYEIKRQSEILEKGGSIAQETRGWDEGKQATFSQRIKEGSADYRYFPDPDIPSLKLSELDELKPERLQMLMPELPWERRERYVRKGIRNEDAELYTREVFLGDFFDEVISSYEDEESIRLASNYIANDLVNILKTVSSGKESDIARDTEIRDTEIQRNIPISSGSFRKIMDLVRQKKLSSRGAKDVLFIAMTEQRDPEDIAREKNLFQDSVNSEDLRRIVKEVLDKNPLVAAEYRAGKAASLEYLLGQAMKTLRGAGDPTLLRDLFKAELG